MLLLMITCSSSVFFFFLLYEYWFCTLSQPRASRGWSVRWLPIRMVQNGLLRCPEETIKWLGCFKDVGPPCWYSNDECVGFFPAGSRMRTVRLSLCHLVSFLNVGHLLLSWFHTNYVCLWQGALHVLLSSCSGELDLQSAARNPCSCTVCILLALAVVSVTAQ